MKKILAVVLCLALALTAMVMPAAAEATEKVYRTYMGMDYPTLNVHNSVEAVLETLASYTGAALYRPVPKEDGTGFHYIGDAAADLPVQIDDYTWQISIRPEACWANGEPINADTYIYSFKMLLDPKLVNSMSNFVSNYSIHIVNADEYAAQGTAETVAWEDVGIKKIDDYTIQITTVDKNTQTDVCTHFATRASIAVYEPYYEAGMNADRTATTYGASLDQYMAAGPYTLGTWTYSAQQTYVKNEKYWMPDLTNYTSIEVYIVADSNAAVVLWEKGEIDDMTPDASSLDTYIDSPYLVEYSSNTVHHIDVNCKNPNNPVCGSINYRKAMYHAMNREILADLFGYKEPTGTYASGQTGILSASGLTYRASEYGLAVTAEVEEWGPYGYNAELANEYLAAAYAEAGLADDYVLELHIAYDPSDSAGWKNCVEYLQGALPEIFNGKVSVVVDTYGGISTTTYKNEHDNWDLSPNEWARSAARTYPYQIFYYYTSFYANHPNNFLDDEFDAQYKVCEGLAADYMACLEQTAELERIYLAKVINIPIVQEVSYTLFSDRIELPVNTYIPGYGWGTLYGDIK